MIKLQVIIEDVIYSSIHIQLVTESFISSMFYNIEKKNGICCRQYKFACLCPL